MPDQNTPKFPIPEFLNHPPSEAYRHIAPHQAFIALLYCTAILTNTRLYFTPQDNTSTQFWLILIILITPIAFTQRLWHIYGPTTARSKFLGYTTLMGVIGYILLQLGMDITDPNIGHRLAYTTGLMLLSFPSSLFIYGTYQFIKQEYDQEKTKIADTEPKTIISQNPEPKTEPEPVEHRPHPRWQHLIIWVFIFFLFVWNIGISAQLVTISEQDTPSLDQLKQQIHNQSRQIKDLEIKVNFLESN